MLELNINGELFMMHTPQMAGIDRNNLGEKHADLSHLRSEILAAINFVFTGI